MLPILHALVAVKGMLDTVQPITNASWSTFVSLHDYLVVSFFLCVHAHELIGKHSVNFLQSTHEDWRKGAYLFATSGLNPVHQVA